MGWVFKYAWMSINGSMYAMQSNMEVIGSTFGQTASAWGANFWIIIALIASFIIMSMGVSGGIEKANKIMMPILFVLFVLLGIYIVFQPGSSNGYKYIFTVNFEGLLNPKNLDFCFWTSVLFSFSCRAWFSYLWFIFK